jgi:hypothetical protein
VSKANKDFHDDLDFASQRDAIKILTAGVPIVTVDRHRRLCWRAATF